MLVWKPILAILPAGLVLGMIGGHLAHPVMQQRGDDVWASIFETRADRYGSASDYPAQIEGAEYYAGGYSYAPNLDPQAAGWFPPYDDRDWTYSDLPLPSVAQLDARQAALLADPEVEFAVHLPADDPTQMAAQDADIPQQSERPATTELAATAAVESGPEPRTADGQPAIW